MKRERRIKIRLSDTELYDLHILAERHHTSVAGLLRNSVVHKERIQRVFVEMRDLQTFTKTISSLDAKVFSVIAMLQRHRGLYDSIVSQINKTIHGIDTEYGVIRRMVLKQRQKAAKLIEKGLKKSETNYVEPSVLNRATTVSLSEDEYETLQKIAAEENSTLSHCLKAHAFGDSNACYTVDYHSLNDLIDYIVKQQRFIDAIISSMNGPYIKVDDVENILYILRETHLALTNKKPELSQEHDMSLYVKKKLKGGTSWQL